MTTSSESSSTAHLNGLFQLQSSQQQTGASSLRERINKLKRLKRAILNHRQELEGAMWADFRKPAIEVGITEIYPVLSEIRYVCRNLKRWMSPQPVPTPITLLGSRSHIQYQPKGVVLIISPWNFPVNLTLMPLVSALAAGNSAILKPSEHTPHTSAVMKKIIEQAFEAPEAVLVEGGVESSQALLELPFNHIFFTGAPAIGKIVMAAAAKHLASVTLELGGKSPTIVDETADLDSAAARTVWGKFVNNGQICVSPDYLFVHESRQEEFVAKLRQKLREHYGEDARQSADYARIVNQRHFQRLKGYLDDAVERGSQVLIGGQTEEAEDYIAPTVISEVPLDAKLMTEEIFGPILPIYPYRDLQEPIELINAREKPLALYLFSKSRKNIETILNHTRAGGTCINHNVVHFGNYHLPFGGDNHSGIGKSHGWFGFEAFSNARAVYRQTLPWSAGDWLTAPYGKWKQRLVEIMLRWL
jgi:aldehyde dehydrogenase (NAD+)